MLHYHSHWLLWVLRDNKRGIAFYKNGFTFDGQEKYEPVRLRMMCSSKIKNSKKDLSVILEPLSINQVKNRMNQRDEA